MATGGEEQPNPDALVSFATLNASLNTAMANMEKSILDNMSSFFKPFYAQMEEMRKDLKDTTETAEKALNVSLSTQNDIHQLQQLEDILAEKAIKADLTMRQNNLKIRGLSEKIGKQEDLTEILTTWLIKEVPPPGNLSAIITKAYRAGPISLLKTRPSRDIIATFMDLRYKKEILNAARQKGFLIYRENKIEIYPDLPREAIMKRRELKPLTSRLAEENINTTIELYRIILLDLVNDCAKIPSNDAFFAQSPIVQCSRSEQRHKT
ncbi:UNVERIFIED_CONTAM: hypothetical protein K2H54_001657 [Gekko kuhli]